MRRFIRDIVIINLFLVHFKNWQLDKRSYQVACKAVSWNRTNRYRTFEEFFHEWKSATEIS